jgi:hypothetical protein
VLPEQRGSSSWTSHFRFLFLVLFAAPRLDRFAHLGGVRVRESEVRRVLRWLPVLFSVHLLVLDAKLWWRGVLGFLIPNQGRDKSILVTRWWICWQWIRLH